ncbi:Chromodomain Y-like protein 2 [Taenia crassiceps]|uniref:Chromodomain Y-like protein 2 n=1 Tax=Taenia crassiceps TaxID=6207 RepID=A0ABR4Q772_9CEST
MDSGCRSRTDLLLTGTCRLVAVVNGSGGSREFRDRELPVHSQVFGCFSAFGREMPSASSDNAVSERSSSSTSVRFSRRTASDVARLATAESLSKDSAPTEPPRKRSRNSVDSSAPSPRKSVTVTVKAQDTEEFHSPSAAAIESGLSTPSKNGLVTPQTLPPDASNTEKVISVINFLRDRRRRPDEKIVILYSERMYQMSSTETKASLQSLVEENRIFRVKYPSGISYRYHMSVVARGDTIAQQSNRIRAKYAVSTSKSNGTTKTPSSRTSTPVGETFSGVEMTALKSFLRLISPSGCIVRPSNLTPSGDCPVVDKIRTLLPQDVLGGDVAQSEPGVSVYVLPPPTPVSLETVEKALRSLPHMALTADPSGSSGPRQNGGNGVKSNGASSTPRDFQLLPVPGHLSVQSIVSDPAMSILLRRRPCEGFTELWIRSPGSTLRNTFTLQVLSELTEALQLAEADSQIRAVVIAGVGRVFSSGIDLPTLSASSNSTVAAFVDSLVTVLRAFLLKLSAFPKLLVAGVNGPAEGLATAILPLFDLVYASDLASFHTAYATLGQVPEAGATYTLAQKVGSPLANDLLLAGRRLSAREALQRGLISDVVFPKSFSQEVTLRCARIACQSAAALETTKFLSRLCDRERVDFMINAECHKLADIWKTSEFRVAAANYVQHCMDDFL